MCSCMPKLTTNIATLRGGNFSLAEGKEMFLLFFFMIAFISSLKSERMNKTVRPYDLVIHLSHWPDGIDVIIGGSTSNSFGQNKLPNNRLAPTSGVAPPSEKP